MPLMTSLKYCPSLTHVGNTATVFYIIPSDVFICSYIYRVSEREKYVRTETNHENDTI